MRLARGLHILLVLGALMPVTAQADEILTLEKALSRARERAPSVVSARSRIDEARARLQTASLFLRENPELEAAAGPPTSGDNREARLDIGLFQNLDVAGRRSARIGAARAELTAAIAESENRLRRALRDVAQTFLHALKAQKRISLAADAERIAGEVLEIARRRHDAGDAALLDVNLARAAASRARTETQGARASYLALLGELRVLLGLPPDQPLTLSGELRNACEYDFSELLEKASDRPDLRVLRAELEAAGAELDSARAQAWPALGFGARYEREEGQSFILGAVRLTLPLFDRGQGARAEAQARVGRLRLELDSAVEAVRTEVAAAFEVHRLQNAAVEELERNALPLLEGNEALSRESYEAGQISLIELLLARREILEIRNDYLSRLLEAAVAAAELEASAGVQP